MCSDAEPLYMLIALYNCLFLMLYNSGKMSLNDSETILSYSHSRDIHCDLSFEQI